MKNPIYTSAFWRDAAERTVSTVVVTVLATMGGDALDLFTMDWETVGKVAANVTALTILKTILSANLGAKGTAGFTTATIPVTGGAVGEFQHEAGGGVDTAHPEDQDTGRHHLN